MKVKSVPSRWIYEEGLRLDCSPYMSGAVEARKILENLEIPKQKLSELTEGHNGGIYNGPKFRRNYVDSLENGVPFLTSGNMLMEDLSDLPLLKKTDALSGKLSHLKISKRTTLISCSGTIGRLIYARPEMDGMWSSQDILKVVPKQSSISSGYLYAYLSSTFGLPQIVSGTYGAIIQHLEPHHISNLAVPRFDREIENKIHELVEEAADKRAEASQHLSLAQKALLDKLGLANLEKRSTSTSFSVSSVSSTLLNRLDAAHFSPICLMAEKKLHSTGCKTEHLGTQAEVFTPGIFKRQHVEDKDYGYAYFSGSELFQIDPKPRGYLSKLAPSITEYVVQKNWLLIQDAGQLGGLIGKVTRVNSSAHLGVVSNHLMRIKPSSDIDAGYLFALLASWYGYRAITRHAFGTSIPQLDPKHIANIEIPWPDKEIREKIANPVLKAWQLQDRAIEAEKEAIALVEKAIEEAA